MKNNLRKYKTIMNDSFWSIAALVSMNMIVQFVVYPSWSRQYGAESYGNILYLMSFVNIASVSVGSALNYSRMTSSIHYQTKNGEYNYIMLIFCILSLPFCCLIHQFSGVLFLRSELLLYWVLQCLTMMRYYMDVDFRLSTNYKGYFIYYICISSGYLLGIYFSSITKMWELALIPGEIAGISYVLFKGSYLRKELFLLSENSKACIKLFGIMISSQLVSTLIFNADRMMLKVLLGGTAVTVYYLSSLIGKTISLITTPLNSVIIGYLVRYNGNLTRSFYYKVITIMLLACVFLIGACVFGSSILLPVLYPDTYDMAKPFLLISSSSQVIYFLTSMLTVLLLRFSRQEYQLYINVVYGVLFLMLSLPLTWYRGIWGFSHAILIANLARMAVCIFLGSICRPVT